MDERLKPLKTDNKGNIVTCPLTGWTTVLVAGSALLIAIEYVDHPEQLETGERNSVQIVMSPAQALEIAKQLTDYAKNLAAPAPSGTKLH